MEAQRRGGIIQVQVDGVMYDAKGNFTYNLGRPKREAIVGADRIHGFKETPQVGFIEGEFTDRGDLDVNKVVTLKDATETLSLANGKVIVLRGAYYAGDGTGNTDEGNMDFRAEGEAEEIT
jgi:hypothetical protein